VIAVLVFLLLAWIAGIPLALMIDRTAKGALLAGEALLVGIAACSAVLLIVPWSRPLYIGVLLAVAIIAGAMTLRVRRTPDPVGIQHSALAIPFHLATIVLLAGYAKFATSAPLWEFDFLVDWGLKAKQFLIAGGVDWSFLEGAWYRGTHPDYPPLLPLAFDGASILHGAWDDRFVGLFNVAFALALLLAIYRFAAEELRSNVSAAFIAAALLPLAAVPWIGLAESPFIAYATVGLLLMRRNVAAGSVMLGCAALTKNEGATLIVAAAIALAIRGRGREIARMWPAVAIPLPWWIMRAVHDLPTDITSGNVMTRVMQHATDPAILRALASYSLGKPLFWIGLAAGIALTFRRLDRFIVIAVAIQLLFYIGAYMATPHDVSWHVQWSWERLIAHLTPALTFSILVGLLGPSPGPAPRDHPLPAVRGEGL
jgi:hypothetical protein